jgi:hypothetical protein
MQLSQAGAYGLLLRGEQRVQWPARCPTAYSLAGMRIAAGA